MKKILLALLLFCFLYVDVNAFNLGDFIIDLIGGGGGGGSLESGIDPTKGTDAINPTSGSLSLGSVLSWFKNQLLTIVFIIAVCAFVFIGIRMASARGNPEEFKKSWMHLVYAIIGIFIALAAWGIVNLVVKLGSNF